jgi:lipoyl synthase
MRILNNEAHSTARRSGMARPTFEPDTAGARPPWLRVQLSQNDTYLKLRELVHASGLHTVCESAACPNIGECWSNKALTFMILGNVCTRSCGFCDVQTGRPSAVDTDEPKRVAEALSQLHLKYAVITSVDRDDLPDGGAFIWAETVREIKRLCPTLQIEVLTPDFKGDKAALAEVVASGPDVFAHNIETVSRLHKLVRPQAKYDRTLAVLAEARRLGAVTKSGIMLGLGETFDEVLETLRDLAAAGVSIANLGQYMRPSPKHLPVTRWVTPEEFAALREEGMKMGFVHVESGPLVRSSYRAEEQAGLASKHHSSASFVRTP